MKTAMNKNNDKTSTKNVDKIDDIDMEILRQLQRNANQTTKELAAHVNLSPTPVFERVKQLERNGYIKRYTVILDNEKLSKGFCVFCNIRLKKHSGECIVDFCNAVEEIVEITECYNISGDYDFMLKIQVNSMAHYQAFVQNVLGTIDSVGSIHSLFVLKTVKDSHALPL